MASTAFLTPAALGARAASPPLRLPNRCNASTPPVRLAAPRSAPPTRVIIHATQSDPSPQASTATLPEQSSLLSQLEQVQLFYVNPSTGKKVPCWKFWPPITPIRTGVLQLPNGPVAQLPVTTSRCAQANVFGKKDVLEGDLRNTPIIVFAHGFSQRPLNYFSLLGYFAVQGYVVIAPRTWFLSVLFADVETVGFRSGLPAKLQTALLIDTARTVQVASSYSSCVHVFGHSMGGAMALVYAGYASSTLRSVALMAPEVGGSSLTELNQTVRLDADDGVQRMEKLASEMACRMMVIHGDRDRIVSEDDMQTMFSTFRCTPLTGLMSLKKGTHIGFEDSLEVDLPFIDFEEFLFGIVDFVVFGGIFDIFGLDTKEQLNTTKAVLMEWIENVARDEKDVKEAVESTKVPSESTYSWN